MLYIKFSITNFVTIFLFTTTIYCQNLELILTKNKGGTPTKCIYFVENIAETENKGYKVPKDVQDYLILESDFQLAQSLYYKLKNKQLENKDSLMLEYVNISNQSEKFVKNKIFILSCHILNKRVIIVDNNHNQDFNDDKAFIFDKNIQIKDEKDSISDSYDGNEASINYEYFDGAKIVKDSFDFEIQISNSTISFNGNSKPKHLLMLRSNQHRIGKYRHDSIEYILKIAPDIGELTTYKRYVGLLLIRNKNIDKKFIFTQDSLLTIGNSTYIPKLSLFGDTLKLVKIKNTNYLQEIQSKKIETREQLIANHQGTTVYDKHIQIKDNKTKYTLLGFWGTWCKPCLTSLPKINDYYKKIDKTKLHIIGVACDNDINTVRNYLTKNIYAWDNLFENLYYPSNEDLHKKLQIESYPHYILVDPKGKIIIESSKFDEIAKIVNKIQ